MNPVLITADKVSSANALHASIDAAAAAAIGVDAPAPPEQLEVRDGMVVSDGEGTNYVVAKHANGRVTLTRQIPKIRGKAARKALKRQRQALDCRSNGLAARRAYVAPGVTQ